MQPLIKFKTKALPVLIFFALRPLTQAVAPAPDGGYPGGNTAEGNNALFSLTSGTYNAAVGLNALQSDTTGARNTGIGVNALRFNVASGSNTAVGTNALYHHNSSSGSNTAVGDSALFSNTTAGGNSALGAGALQSNTGGSGNTACGYFALYDNSVGSQNTAVGNYALFGNASGGGNTALGYQAMNNNGGSDNTAVGAGALLQNFGSGENAAIGFQALTNSTGHHNIGLGAFAGTSLTTGNFNIDIGNEGVAGEGNTIRIGANPHVRTFIAGINVATVSGAAVFIDNNAQLGLQASSARFKRQIKPMGNASEAIQLLRPVTFQYKNETKGTTQFGLIAEEVAEVNPDLVVRDKEGKPLSVRYDQVNAMLLNEFLKEHRKVQELETNVARQAKGMKALTAQLREQAAQLQKVSAQLEVCKPSAQVVLNHQ
jgi:hypothetical protein